MRRAVVLPLACAIALGALAVRGRGAAPPDLSTPYDDERVGASEATRAAAAFGLIQEPGINAYVRAIGQKLARHAPGYNFDYRFAIVDDTTPNAFALPGGYVFISRGLLALSNSEDELAGVIGHEIAHVALRHSAARQAAGPPSFLFPMTSVSLAGFTRDLERSADRVGQGLGAVAGYDPAGLTDFLESLDWLERLRFGASRLPSFLDTHPSTGERISESAQRASETAWQRSPGVVADRAGHLRKLDGIVVGGSARQGLFRGERFLHADLGFTIRFPRGWETRNHARAVGAVAPDRRGQVFLELAPGSDPAAAASEWIDEGRRHGLRVDGSKSIRLVGGDAVRVTGGVSGRQGVTRVHATFVAWRDAVYRIIGASATSRHESLFNNVPRSFRPMTPDLLASVTELRLRLAEAQVGETLASLAARSGSDWGAPRLAALNGVASSHRFDGGELVKIVRPESYRPEQAAEAGP